MLKKIGLGVLITLVVFLGYVSTRNGQFKYERSGLIQAPATKIYPYLSQFKLGGEWNPYERKDPNMKKNIVGTDGQVGAIMEFDGNREAGSGKLELLKLVPNELVEMQLSMTKPMTAENLIRYRLTPEGSGTRFSWEMSGDGGFMGKLVTVFMDCEKMVAGDFESGIANLKSIVEAK